MRPAAGSESDVIEALALAASLAYADPPVRYDHAPTLPIFVMVVSNPDAVCSAAPQFQAIAGQLYGCAIPTDDRCLVVLGKGYTQRLYRHERAHCAGWAGTHPR